MAGDGAAAPGEQLEASGSGTTAQKRCKTIRRRRGGRVIERRVCCKTVRRRVGGRVVLKRVCKPDRSRDGTYVGTTSQTDAPGQALPLELVVADGTIRRVVLTANDGCDPDPDRVRLRLGIASLKRFRATRAIRVTSPGGPPGGAPGSISIRGTFSGKRVTGRLSAELQKPEEPIETCLTGRITYAATKQAGSGS